MTGFVRKKEAVVAYFNILAHHFPGRIEENHEYPLCGCNLKPNISSRIY
jgi:hypothetical protein